MKNPRADVWHRQPAEVERQLKHAVAAQEVVTLAGGVPADELFPTSQMDDAMARVMVDDGAAALQYGWPEGHDRLREHISDWMSTQKVPAPPDSILVTSGAQQGLHLLGRLLLPEGAPLAVETPTYLSALQAFDLRKPSWRPVPRLAARIDLAALEKAFRTGARVLYLVATGHNPTGGILSHQERLEILDLAERYDAWIIDDDAYGALRLDGHAVTPLRSHGRHLDRVIHLGSYSKVLAPGLRIGWITGPPALIKEATRIKQAEDLETATLTQRVLARWLDVHPLDRHIQECIAVYRHRRDTLVDALHAAFPDGGWEAPSGGFSLLLRLPGGLDAKALLPAALRAGVAYEPAEPYFVHGNEPTAVRLSFSNVDEYGIRAAVHRLAQVVEEAMAGV